MIVKKHLTRELLITDENEITEHLKAYGVVAGGTDGDLNADAVGLYTSIFVEHLGGTAAQKMANKREMEANLYIGRA